MENRPVAFGMILMLLSVSSGYGLSPQVKYKRTKSIGGSLDEGADGIATDSAGNVYLTGTFQGTLDFGVDFGAVDIKTSTGQYSAFITKHNLSGTYGRTRIISGTDQVFGNGIATDSSDNIYIVGGFRGTVDFGLDFGATDIRTTTGYYRDAFIIKIESDGTYGWSKTMGGDSRVTGLSIAVDLPGNIYLSGDFVGCADFGISGPRT